MIRLNSCKYGSRLPRDLCWALPSLSRSPFHLRNFFCRLKTPIQRRNIAVCLLLLSVYRLSSVISCELFPVVLYQLWLFVLLGKRQGSLAERYCLSQSILRLKVKLNHLQDVSESASIPYQVSYGSRFGIRNCSCIQSLTFDAGLGTTQSPRTISPPHRQTYFNKSRWNRPLGPYHQTSSSEGIIRSLDLVLSALSMI